ncbi:MAG: hypothetical protein R3F15_16005 [Lysobacterales bacterium]
MTRKVFQATSLTVLLLIGQTALCEEIESLTVVESRGIPNGTSEDTPYLEWLKPTDLQDYGYTPEAPVLVGGYTEGQGHEWSAQYFRSLLGPNGEGTTFERVGACCRFRIEDETLNADGVDVGFLDVYEVKV